MGTCLYSSKKNIVTQNKIKINQRSSKIFFNESNSKTNSHKQSNKEVNGIIKFSEPSNNEKKETKETKEEKENSKRKSNHRKTVSVGDSIFINEMEEKLDLKNNQNINSPNKNFHRREQKSLSLIEKKKMGSQIYKDELNLKITLNTIIEENYGFPSQKYKVLSRLGDGSYGTVY